MKSLRRLWVNISLTCLRFFPFRAKTGLHEIGNPGPSSPVLLTGNFLLTVERVKGALSGRDAFLLVANSRGVNVWCAATGGLLTNHDVISVLKTSGIQERVGHRKIILPQLAATGIEGAIIHDKTGWSVVWGPVHFDDIDSFLTNGLEKSAAARTVGFEWPGRMEMAVAWAFPMSVLALLVYALWGYHLLPLLGLIWGLSLALFLTFPLYRGFLRRQKGTNVVLRQVTVGMLLWLLLVTAFIVTGELSLERSGHWSLVALVIVLILCVDLSGSTPVYKSGLHEEHQLRITLDPEACEGVGDCETVCPADVFDVDYAGHTAVTPRLENCVRCGACIVQCPLDALLFMSPGGDLVRPETVRRFKLNLMGKRMVKADKTAIE